MWLSLIKVIPFSLLVISIFEIWLIFRMYCYFFRKKIRHCDFSKITTQKSKLFPVLLDGNISSMRKHLASRHKSVALKGSASGSSNMTRGHQTQLNFGQRSLTTAQQESFTRKIALMCAIDLKLISIRVEMKNPPGYYPPGKTRAGQYSKSGQYWALLGNIIF